MRQPRIALGALVTLGVLFSALNGYVRYGLPGWVVALAFVVHAGFDFWLWNQPIGLRANSEGGP